MYSFENCCVNTHNNFNKIITQNSIQIYILNITLNIKYNFFFNSKFINKIKLNSKISIECLWFASRVAMCINLKIFRTYTRDSFKCLIISLVIRYRTRLFVKIIYLFWSCAFDIQSCATIFRVFILFEGRLAHPKICYKQLRTETSNIERDLMSICKTNTVS